MSSPKQTIGYSAEDDALKFLTKKGMKLIERNFACKLGEIDLIMQDNDQLVFVEVRFRSMTTHGQAAETITAAKIKRIIRSATLYLQMKNLFYKVSGRFDVVAIDAAYTKQKITWYKNAFTT